MLTTHSEQAKREAEYRFGQSLDLVLPGESFHSEAESVIRRWFDCHEDRTEIRILVLPSADPEMNSWNPREESQPFGQIVLSKCEDYSVVARPGERIEGKFGAVEVLSAEIDWE